MSLKPHKAVGFSHLNYSFLIYGQLLGQKWPNKSLPRPVQTCRASEIISRLRKQASREIIGRIRGRAIPRHGGRAQSQSWRPRRATPPGKPTETARERIHKNGPFYVYNFNRFCPRSRASVRSWTANFGHPDSEAAKFGTMVINNSTCAGV